MHPLLWCLIGSLVTISIILIGRLLVSARKPLLASDLEKRARLLEERVALGHFKNGVYLGQQHLTFAEDKIRRLRALAKTRQHPLPAQDGELSIVEEK